MDIKNYDELIKKAGKCPPKVVAVGGAHDKHTLEAVLAAEKNGLIKYLLVGEREQIIEIGHKLGHKIDTDNIIDAYNETDAAFKAVQLIREKKADFLMKGRMTTADILKAVLDKETGIRKEEIMSHVAFLQIPSYHKLVTITDGGMILYPNLEQKKGIVRNAVELLRNMGYEKPKVAVLAAVETLNEKMPETVDAASLKELAQKGEFGACILDGPISFDLAVSAESALIKGYQSPVTGDVDIMVVPNISTGNILSKGLMYMAGAVMAGCVLGAQVPIVLTSRGASYEEKYYSLLLCTALN